MAEDTQTNSKTEKASTSTDAFLKASGFKVTDILDSNPKTRVFVTNDGGKYRLTPKGRVLRLSGPLFPKEVDE